MYVGQNSVAWPHKNGMGRWITWMPKRQGNGWVWGWEATGGGFEQQRASLAIQRVKNLRAVQETWVWSLGWQDPLEKGMATHSSILAWRIPWTEEPGKLQSVGSQRVRHDWVTHTHTHTHTEWHVCERVSLIMIIIIFLVVEIKKIMYYLEPKYIEAEHSLWSTGFEIRQNWVHIQDPPLSIQPRLRSPGIQWLRAGTLQPPSSGVNASSAVGSCFIFLSLSGPLYKMQIILPIS